MFEYKIKRKADENREYDSGAVKSSDGVEADTWVENNRELFSRYRDHLEIVKEVYDLAYDFLCKTFEKPEDIVLPIDARKLAEACGFSVAIEDFSGMKKGADRMYSPVAQLQMRRRTGGQYQGQIAGAIRIADYLGDKSVNFSIAHELGHYILREHSPIGLNFLEEACLGMYPLCKTDELLMDLFAYGLLLPYQCFSQLKEEYENDNTRWPIDMSDWIAFLRDKTQMPEYHVVLAYQGIKQYALAKKKHEAEQGTEEWKERLIRVLLYDLKMTKREVVSILQIDDHNRSEQEELLAAVEWIQDKEIQKKWRKDYEYSLNNDADGETLPPGQEDDQQANIFVGCKQEDIDQILLKLYDFGLSEKLIAEKTGEDMGKITELIKEYEKKQAAEEGVKETMS
ncbi:MAG: ImmA/IrrE family metallo-endopeptidase [Eubacterium sp.]|nr:ImmA/IrrE family metallo-endopeptidase [Eubacterium sp.]